MAEKLREYHWRVKTATLESKSLGNFVIHSLLALFGTNVPFFHDMLRSSMTRSSYLFPSFRNSWQNTLCTSHAYHTLQPSKPLLRDNSNNTWHNTQIMKTPHHAIFSVILLHQMSQIQTFFSNPLQVLALMWQVKFHNHTKQHASYSALQFNL